MKNWNKYYKIAFWGALVTFLIQLMVSMAIDPYLVAVFSPFYAVWFIIAVVGWRKEHPRL
jgi:hypothetical protein